MVNVDRREFVQGVIATSVAIMPAADQLIPTSDGFYYYWSDTWARWIGFRNERIDTSDIPEQTEDWFRQAKLRGRRSA